MMSSPVFAFYLTCLFLGNTAQMTDLKVSSSVRQERSFVSVKAGENLTLPCFFKTDVFPRLYWFKQTLTQKPRMISSYSKYKANATLNGEFRNNPRFTINTKNGIYHLTITDLQISDSATYYCFIYLYTLESLESIVVSVKGSGLNIPISVHQSASESIQPGGSVTLNCTVHTGTCDGEHSVYWFKTSEEAHPGLIYTHEDRKDQCERKANTQTRTCVYHLPMESLDVSHAGTYYCAVASCGHILFGDGTKLDFQDEADLVYFLSGASAFTTILAVLLAFSLCMLNKRNSCQSTESQARCSAPSKANAEVYQNAENLYYAALSANLPTRSRRLKDRTWSECVYYSVKH